MRYLHIFCVSFVLSGIGMTCAAEPTVEETQGERGIRQVAVEKPSPHKVLLIGINDYAEPMSKLTYCIGDVKMLADILEKVGVDSTDMILMTDDAKLDQFKPNRANIFRQLRSLMRDATEDDTITIAFSGHGLHIDGVSYLCPGDGDPDVPETLISHREITRIMDTSKAKRKLFLIDACRNTPLLKGGRSGPNTNNGFDKVFDTAKGTAFLLSCSEGEVTWEFDELNHGAFSYFITQGLSGEADENEDGEVSLQELIRYVSEHTKKYVKEKRDRNQTPSFKGDIADSLDKFILTRKGTMPRARTKESWGGRAVHGSYGKHHALVRCVVSFPDGKRFATGGDDGSVRVWDIQSGKQMDIFFHSSSVIDIAISQDGKYLLVGCGDSPTSKVGFINPSIAGGFIKDRSHQYQGYAVLWDIEKHVELCTVNVDPIRVQSVVISPDNKSFFTGMTVDPIVKEWEIPSGNPVNVNIHGETIESLNPSTGEKILSFVDTGSTVWDIAITKDGQYMAAVMGRSLKIFDEKFQPIGSVSSSTAIMSVDFANSSERFLTASSSGVTVWNGFKNPQKSLVIPSKKESGLPHARFSPDGKSIAMSTQDGIFLYDSQSGEQIQHYSTVFGSCEFTPDGRTLLGLTRGYFPMAWNVQMNRAETVYNYESPIEQFFISPDGSVMLFISGEKCELIDTSTQKTLHVFGKKSPHTVAAFSACGRFLAWGATGEKRDDMIIWNLKTNEQIHKQILPDEKIVGLWFSPEGNVLLTVTDEGNLIFFFTTTGEVIAKINRIANRESITAASFSSLGKRLCLGLSNGESLVFDNINLDATNINEIKLIITDNIRLDAGRRLSGHVGKVSSIQNTPKNELLFTTGEDRKLLFWGEHLNESFPLTGRRRDAKVVYVLDEQILSSALSGNGIDLTASGTSQLFFLNLETSHYHLYHSKTPIVHTAFISQQKEDWRVAFATADGTVKHWMPKTIEPLSVYPKPEQMTQMPWTLSVSPDGKRLAVGGATNLVKQWNLETGVEAAADFTSGTGSVYCVRYSHDGKRLACATSGKDVPLPVTKEYKEDKEGAEKWEMENVEKMDELDITARIYKIDDGEEQLVLRGHKNRLLAIEFTPDDKYVLTGSMDRTIRLWDAKTGEELYVWHIDSGVASLDILQDGKRFVSGHADGTVNLWDLEKKTCLRSMKGDNGIIWQVAASPNGRFLLSCGFENPSKLWNLGTGEMIRQIGEYSGTEAVAFSPDGRYYLITDRNGHASLRRFTNDMPIATFGLGQNNAVRAFVFTPDGQNIITGFWSGEVVLWE